MISADTGKLILLLGGVLFLTGCDLDGLPAYTNDGKTIIVSAANSTGDLTLYTYELDSKAVTSHPLPDESSLNAARMLGEQIWVQSKQGFWRFDPVKKQFLPGAPESIAEGNLRHLIPASQNGQPCMFLYAGSATTQPTETDPYEVYSFPEFKKLNKTVHLHYVIPAGRFWWVNVFEKIIEVKGKKVLEPAKIELFNSQGEIVLTIPSEEACKLKEIGGRAPYARFSEDEKVLLLAFGEGGTYNFGFFDTTSGQLLWSGKTKTAMSGTPLVKRTEMWLLEAWYDREKEKTEPIELVRYRPGEKPDSLEAKRDVIMKYPIQIKRRLDQYTLAPDKSHFILSVNGDRKSGTPSRLLFIPIKEGVTLQDVQVIELKTSL